MAHRRAGADHRPAGPGVPVRRRERGADPMTDPDDRLGRLLALTAEMGDPVKDYVILAEGNTSTRIDAGSMWVKASGVRLEHADGPDAFVAVELEPLMRALRGRDDGADLSGLLARARVAGQP